MTSGLGAVEVQPIPDRGHQVGLRRQRLGRPSSRPSGIATGLRKAHRGSRSPAPVGPPANTRGGHDRLNRDAYRRLLLRGVPLIGGQLNRRHRCLMGLDVVGCPYVASALYMTTTSGFSSRMIAAARAAASESGAMWKLVGLLLESVPVSSMLLILPSSPRVHVTSTTRCPCSPAMHMTPPVAMACCPVGVDQQKCAQS